MTEPAQRPRKRSPGCLLALGLLALLLPAAVLWGSVKGYVLPNTLMGDLVDVCYAPGEGGGLLWVLTDDSFYYTHESNCGGTRSVSSECLGCKHRLYGFDPASEEVRHQQVISYPDLPPQAELVHSGAWVWLVGPERGDTPPTLRAYDSSTHAQVLDTAGFVRRHKQAIGAGITELDLAREPLRLELTTRDGRELTYLFGEDVVVSDEDLQARKPASAEVVTRYVLGRERSGTDRYRLFRVTGPRSRVRSSWSAEQLSDPGRLAFRECAAEPLSPEAVYLDPILLHQDADGAVLIHQDAIGKSARRSLTLVGRDGRARWTVPPAELFEELMVTPDDSFSSTFFVKSRLDVVRAGDAYLLSLKKVGLLAFDGRTGKTRWSLEF